ncbi:MAG: amidase [Frankiales bacterium]|nr:amidase [Frankiales bacterium]
MAALHDLSALEQAAAIRAGEISPVELTTHYLERIERLSNDVGAFVTVTAESALASARSAEAELARRTAPVSALYGVPTAIKDLTAVAGVEMRMGTAAFDPLVPDTDDHVVTRLKAAGMPLLGKTSTPEFGLPLYTEPDGQRPARSPWDLAISAGGSSGGAAAAVASGLVPVAHGSDGGGSVRTPAAICGLVGVKSSRDRISLGPRPRSGPGLGVHGFLTRTVADAAALLDATSGPMPGDATWLPLTSGRFVDATRRDPGRLRVGRHLVPTLADVEPHPDVIAAYEAVSSQLTELGHEVVDVAPPFGREVIADFETVWAKWAASIPIPADREHRLTALTRWLQERGAKVSAADYVRALGRLQLASRAAISAAAAYDVVLVPTLADLPKRVGELRDDDDPAADFAAQERFNPYSAAYNMTGQPAITVPLHWTAAGVPVGVQLVGAPAGEAVLLTLAAQLEEARPWRDRTPPSW